jgi:hypothetical protein
VSQVTIHHDRDTNKLCGISVYDREGDRLFKTFVSKWIATQEHTIELLPGERWVGVKSFAKEGKFALHWDFQLVIMRNPEESGLSITR